jgi:guanylate kinase
MNNQKETDAQMIVLAGPSGSGKNTLMHLVLESCPNCTRLVTATTRAPRPGEKDGVDYYFMSKEEFQKAVSDGRIPEFRHVPNVDTYYGTYLPDLDQKLQCGKTVLAQVDIIGAKYFKKNYGAKTIFIMPLSKDILIERIKRRADMDADELKERIKIAEREIDEDSKFYDYVIVNEEGKPEEAAEKILQIISE